MGREERNNALDAKMAQAMAERTLGGTRPFGIYDQEGCPKCGGKILTKVCCVGAMALERDPRACPIDGEHLHGWCGYQPHPGLVNSGGCGFSWVEHTKDWRDPDLEP